MLVKVIWLPIKVSISLMIKLYRKIHSFKIIIESLEIRINLVPRISKEPGDRVQDMPGHRVEAKGEGK